MPQAVVWAKLNQQLEVAHYVRRLVQAEQRDSSIQLGTLVRQLADNLGLTTPGMLRNRWRVEEAAKTPASARPVPIGRGANRFKVVNGDGA